MPIFTCRRSADVLEQLRHRFGQKAQESASTRWLNALTTG